MEKEHESDKRKPAKQGYASAAKVASLKLFYGLMNKYSPSKAKQIELKSVDEEIIVLGRHFKLDLRADEGGSESRIRFLSCNVQQSTNPSPHLDSENQPDSENQSTSIMEEKKISFLVDPGYNTPMPLKKNLSEASIDHKDKLQAVNEDLKDALAYVCCFTYRNNWGEPIPNTTLFSDAGWGCMIRVGQMAFFNCLIRDQMLKDEDFLNDRLKYLLMLFNDCNEGEICPFSIKNIVPMAFEKYNISMGSWFRSTSIMMCLDHLNRLYKPNQTSHIKMVTMLDSTFLLSRLYEAFTDQRAAGLDEDQMMQELCQPWGEKRLIITLTSMLGMNKPQKEYKKCLNFLLSMPYSVGILGGSDHRAYYIIGYNNAKKVYYYLDPHSVQVGQLSPLECSQTREPGNRNLLSEGDF